jgi:tetratricopeptide (TPR) repeat protein
MVAGLRVSFAVFTLGTSLVERGLDLGFNLDYDQAAATFRQAGAVDPVDSTPPRLEAAVAWSALLNHQGAITVADYLGEARATVSRTPPDPALVSAFRDALRRALARAEQLVRDRPRDAEAHYQLGAAYGLLASYTATVEGRVLASVGPARRAYREHERVLELDPQRKDAGLIVGTYRYGVSSLPLPLRIAARAAGFRSGHASSIRLIEEAAACPGDARPSALFVLALVYNRESRFDDALRVIERLQTMFPRNRLLWLEAASTALRANRGGEALSFVERGLERRASDLRAPAFGEDARWAHIHGVALVAAGRPIQAAVELRAALDLPARDWVRGRVHAELGKLADAAGDRATARAEYQVSQHLCDRDGDRDCIAAVKLLLTRAGRPERDR